jgi:hypothetical protein
MNQKEWYAKLEEWAFDDARLHRLPLALLPALAEHIANEQAVEQQRAADATLAVAAMNIANILDVLCEDGEE